MPPVPLRFPTFRIVLSLVTAAVWGLILLWIGSLVASQFQRDDVVDRSTLFVTLAATALVAGVLAVQNAVVSLEHGWLHGRFTGAPATVDPRAPRNVWRVAVSASLLFCAVWVPLWLAIGRLAIGPGLSSGRTSLSIAGLGFVEVALAVYLFPPLELSRRVSAVGPAGRPVGPYLRWQCALPWALVNGILGGVIAWLSSPAHRDPSVHVLEHAQLAVDMAVATFLICVFMGLVTLPEAEVDVARGRVVVERSLAPMPRLWLRYLYAALAAVGVWLLWTLFAAASGLPALSLPVSFGIKTVLGGVVGAVAAWRCAAWSAGRAAGSGRQAPSPAR